MENQIQAFVLISSIALALFILIGVYLIIRLKLNDILLKRSEGKLKNFNETLQYMVAEKTEKLQLSEKNFRNLYELNKEVLENSPAGIIKLNRKHEISYMNQESISLLTPNNNDTNDLLNQLISRIPQFNRAGWASLFNQLKKGNEIEGEETFSQNTEKSIVKIKGVPIFEEGIYSGAVLLLNDNTESILAEEKLRRSLTMLQKATEDIIQAMSYTSEIRDPYTAGHQKKVCELAITIGKELNITEEQLQGVKFAAMIHDIGKISVPSDILSKPGKIGITEFEVVKGHSQTGYELLDKINFPWPISDIVYQHHERLDGSGYPNGLKGKQILLEAKIISVADTVEAMTSHRPYRPALGLEKALEDITQNKGTYFDPNVVDACIKIFDNGFQFSE
ncbi:MAG: HD-GYP domain-containing protein [Candidatus Cloacimonetes bacterium]|jgi:putative nucleotidyltransferase with HDIG domain|nr:HD-GYP domain-containing protein [Candidatus Cloacimonadota bacterium]